MPRPAIDLNRPVFEHTRGDIKIIGTWWLGERDDEIQPCLVLIPLGMRRHGFRPGVVQLSNAWCWGEEQTPHYCIRMAQAFIDGWGREHTLADCMKVVELIRDHIDHLCRIPPRPTEGSRIVADATMTTESGRVHHSVITEYN